MTDYMDSSRNGYVVKDGVSVNAAQECRRLQAKVERLTKDHGGDCRKILLGPLGSPVGFCERHRGHDGPCEVNGRTEQDMVDFLTRSTA